MAAIFTVIPLSGRTERTKNSPDSEFLTIASIVFGGSRSSSGRRSMGFLRGGPDRPAPLQLNLPERTAVNTVIQGTAADLIKLAMLA